MKISNRVNKMQYSAIRALVPLAEKAKSKGIKVNHLNVGVPDFKTPAIFLDRIKAFEADRIVYANAKGLRELRIAISDFYKDKYNLDYPIDSIAITSGASEALKFTLMAITDYGDKVLTADPYYSNYKSYFDKSGISLNTFATCFKENFSLPSKEEIESKIDDKTKAILICNPDNPTGKVYTKTELTMLTEIAKENDLYIIGDEIYRDFVYNDQEFTSLGEFSKVRDNVILIDSISKRFSACGARIGAVLSKNAEFMEAIFKLCTARLAVATIEQYGAVGLYQLRDDYVKQVREDYQVRADLASNLLKKIEGIKVTKPEGAFYIMVKLPVSDSNDFSSWLLTDFNYQGETVMVAPASGFYQANKQGNSEIRIAFAVDVQVLIKGIDLLERGLIAYKKHLN